MARGDSTMDPHSRETETRGSKMNRDLAANTHASGSARTRDTGRWISASPDFPRNHASKRHSLLFGRAGTDAPNHKRAATLHETMTSQNAQPSATTPQTAAQAESRRRKTEPLNTIRRSFFGGRNKPGNSNTTDIERRQLFPADDSHRRCSTTAICDRAQFKSQEEYDRYLFKMSISLPFGFQHITHTARKHLPRLESVDEKDLTAEFWAVSAEQKPRSTLTGIKAHDIDNRRRDVTRGPTSPRPTAPVPANPELDRAREESVSTPKISPRSRLRQDRIETAGPQPTTCNMASEHPRRHSSMNALNQQWPMPPNHQPQKRYSAQFGLTSHQKFPSGSARTRVGSPLDSMSEEVESLHTRELSGASFRAKQPLPPLPNANPTTRTSDGPQQAAGARKEDATPRFEPRLARPFDQSSDSHAQDLTIPQLSREAWEDDVDFCYQQEAESTCNFDWRTGTPVHDMASEGRADDGRRLSVLIPRQPVSPALRSFDSCEALSISSMQQHRRGSSVGHRGFLAARNASSDALPRRDHSPALATTPELETCPSSAGAQGERELFKPPFAPGYVHLPGYTSNGGEYFSDMDSTRSTVSRHRKSSSYGSYDSGSKSATSGSDSARWSGASTSSLPDLLHGQRKNKPAGSKSKLGTPLETLPQSPGFYTEPETVVPISPTLPESVEDGLFLRRPETPGDRAILQHAGRVVQRGRPSTPIRFSRLSSPTNHGKDDTTWI